MYPTYIAWFPDIVTRDKALKQIGSEIMISYTGYLASEPENEVSPVIIFQGRQREVVIITQAGASSVKSL